MLLGCASALDWKRRELPGRFVGTEGVLRKDYLSLVLIARLSIRLSPAMKPANPRRSSACLSLRVNFCLWHEPAALPISGSAIYGLFADPDPSQNFVPKI